MKKLISLLLALILCFGVLVACDNEEESSSEESSDLSLVENEDSTLEQDDDLPVFPTIFKNKYICYNVTEKQSLWYNGTKEGFQRWIFNDRASFISFLQENTGLTDSSKISEQTFEDGFVIVIYRSDDIRQTENYAYGNFNWNPADGFYRENGFYSITLEYTEYEGRAYTEEEIPPSFDIVVVPREDSKQEPSSIAEDLYIQTIVHEYAVAGELIK